MAQAILEELGQDETLAILGSRDENLRLVREALDLKVVVRHGTISLEGDEAQVEIGRKLLTRMRARFQSHQPCSADDVRVLLRDFGHSPAPSRDGAPRASMEIAGPLRKLHARTPGQGRYLKAIRQHDLVMCIGPAGTGKTYLAVAAALEAMHQRQIKRLVLVRPAVEAGEKLGFLPGDLEAKVNPFLRPLLDALREMLDFHQVRSYLDDDIVEIAPLAYMRGRTLNESFIILDEGQNTTIPQMKMFLTRMGMGSKIVVTGDITQVDLPPGTRNGLSDAIDRLGSLPQVAAVRMDNSDIVRHPLVQAIVSAYETPRRRARKGGQIVEES